VTELAFLGTGTMGLPMARNLITTGGFSLRVWNRSKKRAQPLAEQGARVCAEVVEAAQDAQLLVTMLSDGDAVLDVAAQALPALADGAIWNQMSTIGIDATRRCAELAHEAGVRFVDAPVLGTREPAEQGTLVVLASGPDQARETVTPVFDAVGSHTLWVGETGAGSRLKVVVNGWVVGVVGVLAEVITLAEGLDLDPQLFLDAIEGGALDLPYAKLKGKAMMSHRFDDASFRLGLARKDGDLLLAAAEQAGLQLPIMDAIVARMRTVEADGHGDEDMAATYWASARNASRP
jgi:3-hydroxyisobutyrate dehydrogenase